MDQLSDSNNSQYTRCDAPSLDVTMVETAVDLTRDIFGTAAMTAAARCALVAESEGKDADYHFWLAVFNAIKRSTDKKLPDMPSDT